MNHSNVFRGITSLLEHHIPKHIINSYIHSVRVKIDYENTEFCSIVGVRVNRMKAKDKCSYHLKNADELCKGCKHL